MAFQHICFALAALIGLSLSARVNMEDMDYNSLISLLSEYEDGDADETAAPVINNISLESNIQKQQFRPTSVVEDPTRDAGATLDFSFVKPSASNLLAPQVEVLALIEAFLKLKGEMASRIHALINDNFDLLHSVYNVVMSKVSKFHNFTLIGISVIRKICEFAVQMISSWEVNAPSVSFGFNKY